MLETVFGDGRGVNGGRNAARPSLEIFLQGFPMDAFSGKVGNTFNIRSERKPLLVVV
jgi:hypothetical protein